MMKKQAYKISPYDLQDRINEAGEVQSVHALRGERCQALLKAWLAKDPKAVGKDFEDFVRGFMFHKGNYTSGATEYTQWLAEEIEWNFGFDPRKVELDDEAMSTTAAGRYRAVQAESAYTGKIIEHESKGPYDRPDEHPRHCPEHAGIQLRRVPTDRPDGLTPDGAKGGDGIYQCPIDGETYSYTGGHEVEFKGSSASQTVDGMSGSMEEASGTVSSEAPYKMAQPDFEPVEQDEGSWNERRKRLCPFLASEEETPWGLDIEEKPEKDKSKKKTKSQDKSLKKSKEKTESNGQTKKADLFGPVQKMTRDCPDHPGSALARVSDKVYQCSLDGRMYDFERGFKTDDGEEHHGGSVAQMTPDSPGYYQSPHPPHLFPGVPKDAALGDVLTKHAGVIKEALDARGLETRFCNDVYDALAGDMQAAQRVNDIISHIRQGDNRPLGVVAQQIYEQIEMETVENG